MKAQSNLNTFNCETKWRPEVRREQKSDALPEPDMNRSQQKENPQFACISFSEKRKRRVTCTKRFSLELNLKLMYRALYKAHWITPVVVL